MRGLGRRALPIALCVGLVLCGAIVAAGPASADIPGRGLVVSLHDDGAADVSVTYTYDLADEGEHQALQDLREDETARQELAERFAERLRTVADATAAETGREMSIENPRVAVDAIGDRGAVTVTVTWHGLASVGGDELVVSEPFASEFDPDREVRVEAPNGYTIAVASPNPDRDDGDAVAWSADADLSGFAVTAEPAATGAFGPGLGVAATIAAVAAVAAFLVHRRPR